TVSPALNRPRHADIAKRQTAKPLHLVHFRQRWYHAGSARRSWRTIMLARYSWAARPALWIAAVIVLGLALRGWHYARNPPQWHDETAQVMNILYKGWAEHFGPMFYAEASPPLFMTVEKAIVTVLGDSTPALRLLPFLASCGAFLLMLWIGGRLLPIS